MTRCLSCRISSFDWVDLPDSPTSEPGGSWAQSPPWFLVLVQCSGKCRTVGPCQGSCRSWDTGCRYTWKVKAALLVWELGLDYLENIITKRIWKFVILSRSFWSIKSNGNSISISDISRSFQGDEFFFIDFSQYQKPSFILDFGESRSHCFTVLLALLGKRNSLGKPEITFPKCHFSLNEKHLKTTLLSIVR